VLRRPSLVVLIALASCGEQGPQGGGLSVTPAVVDFGEVVVGLLERRTLVLENRTPEVVRVIEARAADSIAGTIRPERVPAAILAGSTAEVELVFAPDTEGTFSGEVHIVTDGDPAELTVRASGVAVAPFLRAIPETIDFGRVKVGESAVWTATVTNEGSRAVTVHAITPDMYSDEELAIGPYAIETLEPTESFTFEIIFTPIGGPTSGKIVIADDSPRPVPVTISTVGEGVFGDLEIDPLELDFSGAIIGEERTRFFEIRNTGSSTHTIEAIVLSQEDPTAFSVDTSSLSFPFALGPSQERRIAVRFAPVLPTEHEGMIAIESSELTSVVSLYGQAAAPPVSSLLVAPRSIDFGGVEIGSSGARELTIESAGYVEVHLQGALELDPPDAPFSLIRSLEAGATLNGFDSHTLEIVYRPESAGMHTAVLRIRSDAADNPAVEVALRGRGEASPSPDADPRPTSLWFGHVPRDRDARRTILVFNGGTAPLSVTSVELTPDAGGRFTLDEIIDPAPFGPGESRPIRIRYSDPSGIEAVQTGTVAIFTDDPDRPLIRAPLRASTTAPRPDPDIVVRTTALDLHFMQEGALFDRPTDCCWCNPNPAWGNAVGSPLIDNDGGGGQTIVLPRADGLYAVEIHSREDSAVTAEVTIELFGAEPVVRTRAVGPGQRWRVGVIDYFGFQRSGTFTTETLPLDSPMAAACF
jgi:hypothetical protein